MSNNALFSSTVMRGSMKNLVELKAGKMTRKGNMIHPDSRKGQLYLYQSDDSLMHFCWKDRTTGVVEDDLIIFPDDCEFKHVTQCKTGKVYILRFKSSSRKFFFWLQDLKMDKDDEQCKKIHDLLNNPPVPTMPRNTGGNSDGDLQNLLNNMSQQQLMQLFGGVGQIGGFGTLLGSMNRPFNNTRSSAVAENIPTSGDRIPISPPPIRITSNANKDLEGDPVPQAINSAEITHSTDDDVIQLSDLQSFLSRMPKFTGHDSSFQKCLAVELTGILSTAITDCESLELSNKDLLPVGDSIYTTVSSPQFAQSLMTFWYALQSGQVAPVIQQFGLSEKVVTAASSGDIGRFLEALNSLNTLEETHHSSDLSALNNSDDGSPTSQTKKDSVSDIIGTEDDDEGGMSLD